LKSAIKNVDRNFLGLFIINEAALSEGVENRALNFFKSEEHKQTVSFYKKEVNKFLKSLIHDYYISVSRSGELIGFIDNIELIAKRGSIEEAIKYYRAVFEVLEAKLKTLDDSYGVIQDATRSSLNKYIEYSNEYYTKQEEGNYMLQIIVEAYIDVFIHLNNRKEIEEVFEKFSNISGSITYKKIKYLWSIEQFESAIMTFESNRVNERGFLKVN
jgi:uncharacterized glyoxalase superfamily protein PhnB